MRPRTGRSRSDIRGPAETAGGASRAGGRARQLLGLVLDRWDYRPLARRDAPGRPSTGGLGPDMGAATWEDDIDRGIGLCLRGKDHPLLLWVDEYGAVTRAGRTQPNMRRVLHHGRHHDLSLLLACPRPKDVDGLGIAQADLVVTGPTPNPYDRERIASEIGFDPAAVSAVNKELRVEEHTYTAYD